MYPLRRHAILSEVLPHSRASARGRSTIERRRCSTATRPINLARAGRPCSGIAAEQLDWSLDSTWQGLQIGVEQPKWRAHFEWLAPMIGDTYGTMDDFDWSGPARDPASLSSSPERWTDGQMLELEGSF